MVEYEMFTRCFFFQEKMANIIKTTELLKATYSKSDYTNCIRQLIFKTGVKHIISENKI